MGADYYAIAAIGVRVRGELIRKYVKVRENRHCPNGHTNPLVYMFCWQCGAPLFTERHREEFVEGYSRIRNKYDGSWIGERGTLLDGKYMVIWSTDYAWAVICWANHCTRHPVQTGNGRHIMSFKGPGLIGTLNIRRLGEIMKKELEPVGLWDDSAFGIHGVLYVDY